MAIGDVSETFAASAECPRNPPDDPPEKANAAPTGIGSGVSRSGDKTPNTYSKRISEATEITLPKNSREDLRISLTEYHGHDLVDIRTFTEISSVSGIRMPTKKGVSVRVEMLPDLIAALLEVERQARVAGLLPNGGRP